MKEKRKNWPKKQGDLFYKEVEDYIVRGVSLSAAIRRSMYLAPGRSYGACMSYYFRRRKLQEKEIALINKAKEDYKTSIEEEVIVPEKKSLWKKILEFVGYE